MGTRSLAGKLLVAPAAMSDPNFAEAVTLVLVHNDDGAFGLVLDRPLQAEVQLPDAWTDAVDARVWSGGPCEPDRLIALARPVAAIASVGPDHYQQLCEALGGLGVVDAQRADPHEFASIRFFAGYAGWGPGQLDWELSLDAWVVADGDPADPFRVDADGLRANVLRRVLAAHGRPVDFPDDPSAN